MDINTSYPNRNGFTLIELSIVLVIIGLVIGGVLVGQDLIKASEIRGTIAQYEKYNASVNTFRGKYNGLPGDLFYTEAIAFGFYADGMDGSTGSGDGSKLVNAPFGNPYNLGETLAFWRHLSEANLIEQNLGGQLQSGAAVHGNLGTFETISAYLPAAKIGRNNTFSVNQNSGTNYFLLMNVGAIFVIGVSGYSSQLTPIESFNIDSKIDDGAPNTGTAIARGAMLPFSPVSANQATWSASPTNECMTGGGAADSPTTTYNRNSSTGGNIPACGLRMKLN